MKPKASLLLFAFVLLAVSALAIVTPFELPAKSVAADHLASQTESGLAERIKRVEEGLLPPVIIKGQPPAQTGITERMAFYKVPGVSLAVINGGVIEWARGYGVVEAGTARPVTIETLFQAASISKPVAAMGALRLVEEGKLSLDEDINKYLTSWKVPENEFTKEKKVTLRGLLSHSAGMTVHGFRGYQSDEPAPALLQVLNGEKPANSAPIRVDILPGSRWRYSGGGISVMQQMIIDVTGKPFPEFMRRAVLDKLGMKHSTYEQPLPKTFSRNVAAGHRATGEIIKGKWHTYPEMAAAGLWTSASDLARFAIEIQKSKAGKSNRVLSAGMTNQMLTLVKGDYGLGVGLRGAGNTLSFAHGGSNEGFRCFLFAYAETGQGMVVMTNGDGGAPLANEIIRSIAREYGWPDYTVKERVLARVDPKIFASYTGQYTLRGSSVTITTDNGKLYIQAPPFGPDKIEIYPESETKYFVLLQEVTFTFIKDEKGQVTELLVELQGQSQRAKKTG
jgi:CubicO group peptidase (beta-lactamase class C family)